MASDSDMNRRHGSGSVPRGVKRSAEMHGNDNGSGISSPKRPKTADGKESSLLVMHPPGVPSHADSSPMSAIVKPVVLSAVNNTSFRETVPSSDTTATLPTLPTLPQPAAPTTPKPVQHVKASLREENRRTKIESRMVETLSAQFASAPCCSDIVYENGCRRQPSSSLCKRLIGVGAVVLLLVYIYRSSSFHSTSFLDKMIPRSNVTETTEVKVDRALHRPPHRTPSLATSAHLLAIDNYERLNSTLAMVKKELAKAMADLENSRKNVNTAREEAINARNDYARVVSELELMKNELMDKQRHIGLLLQELNHTQKELEHTRCSFQVSEVDLKSTLEELDAAHVTIGDLHHLLQVQEMVAAHALNFVATTAVSRPCKCGYHPTESKQEDGDTTNVEL